MGLLNFVWGIYTELQDCMYQAAHGRPDGSLTATGKVCKIGWDENKAT
jgi:hypothetical protein